MTTDDMDLVRAYATRRSEEAFATLVSRYVNMVYSVALRQVRDAHLAQDVTQAVFIILARKAESHGPKTILSAWLCRTAQYAAADALRSQRRRQCREQEKYMQSLLNQPEADPSPWTDIAPLLDVAMAGLGNKDHCAIVLRFFEGKDLKQVGAALGVSENTAKTRVSRAVEKLRKFFVKRGVSLTADVIAGEISANSIQAAPVALAQAATAAALAKGLTAGASTLTLVTGALKVMAWTKAKTAIVFGIGALLAAGTAITSVKAISHYRAKAREDDVWSHITAISGQQLRDAPPMVSIRPAKPGSKLGNAHVGEGNKQLASDKTVNTILHDAYHIGPARIVPLTPLPPGKYDFIVSLPRHADEALQAAIKEKFGLVGKKEMIETNVLVLKVARPNAPGLKPSSGGSSRNTWSSRRFNIPNSAIGTLAFDLEGYLKIPVIEQTELTGRYDIDIKWNDGDPESLKQVLMNELGLELAPDTQTIEMLVVTKSN